MAIRMKLVADAREALGAVCMSLVAVAVAVCAMAVEGRRVTIIALGVVIFIVAAGTVLQVHYAIRRLRSRSELARRAASVAEIHYVQVLWRIMRFVEARGRYFSGHSENVGRLCEQMARRMGLDGKKCELMRVAGRLHDIGMIAVPEEIVKNKTLFTVDDYRSVKLHSRISYEVLKPLELLADVLPAIRHHHERMNGTGYPDGLSGQSIPLEGRIIAVADSYDAMTHDRPHRAAMTPLQAMRELMRCTLAGYDRECVNALAYVVNLPDLEKMLDGAQEPAVCA